MEFDFILKGFNILFLMIDRALFLIKKCYGKFVSHLTYCQNQNPSKSLGATLKY